MATYRTVRSVLPFVVFLLVVVAIAAPPAMARSLSFQERLAAQRAIEEVYWRHRIWPDANKTPKPPLSSVLSDEAIRSKVADYLKKSNALEEWWRRPVTGEQLQAELDRMSRDTRDPEMLRDLYAALENDAFLIAETLGRQTLVERLVHDWYARDDRFHGELERSAREALAGIRDAAEMRTVGGQYAETTYLLRSEGDDPSNGDPGELVVELEAEIWKEWEARLAEWFGTPANELPLLRLSGLREDVDRFFVVALLSRTDGEATVASVVWPKRSFDAWWEEQAALLTMDVRADPRRFTLDEPPGAGCVEDTWRQRFHVPAARFVHTAIWTGTEMIVWGGYGDVTYTFLNTGGRYSPSTDSWVPTSTGSPVPTGRYSHTAVWTGTEMIVWGGTGGDYHGTGGRYDPLTDTWSQTSTAYAPEGRAFHSAVWTGTEMIIWGGNRLNTEFFSDGGRYDPATDTWTATSVGANVPEVRSRHAAVWTGTEMIVWGGSHRSGAVIYYHDTGGRYDPSSDTWAPTSMSTDAPTPRDSHTAVWTGAEMIVWGGFRRIDDTNHYYNTGGRYDPSSDTWAPTSMSTDVPTPRNTHTAVWTGAEMIVWGGGVGGLNTGGRYHPATDTWVATSTGTDVPSFRYGHSAVWAGTEMIVWGGYGGGARYTGGRYDPSTDMWVSTSVGIDVPIPRHSHTAVWTGAELIVWGGYGGGAWLNTGGRYDLATDTWLPTSTGTNVPSGRSEHTVVWTGTEMIVWGGYNGAPLNTGGRYDPSTDMWASTSVGIDVPIPRRSHTAVWTGTEMIVWGGRTFVPHHKTGGRYDPSTDSWILTSTGSFVPTARGLHTAVWTGTVMVIWGGYDRIDEIDYYYDTGSRYDPSTDSWAMMTTSADVPVGREAHKAVWTGSEMLVWGGYDGEPVGTGGRYDPTANLWAPMTDSSAPLARLEHAAVWTGAKMIVWGGRAGTTPSSTRFKTGGRYDPESDTWALTSTGTDAPSARYLHTAVWTGAEMIVWGGAPGTTTLSFYCASACTGPAMTYRDADGDGYGDPAVFVVSDGCSIPPGYVTNPDDCDDGDAATHAGAEEINDGKDNQCPGDPGYGVADEISGDAGYHNPADKDEYSWPAQPGASTYEVARSSYPDFSADCVTTTRSETYWVDSRPTPSGACSYYLVRPLTPHAGSWGQDSVGLERTNVCP